MTVRKEVRGRRSVLLVSASESTASLLLVAYAWQHFTMNNPTIGISFMPHVPLAMDGLPASLSARGFVI